MARTHSGEKFMSQSMTSELDPRIKIRAPLRCDGVGSLDCAEDIESGMRMAVRWLPLDANGAAAARAVEALPSHPTLPKIRGTGRVGSAAFVAMDFPDGRLLSTMTEEPFTPAQIAKLGTETADALATMHAQDVVHGALSADSILLHGTRAVLWDMPLVLANRLTDRRGEERMLSQLPRIAAYLAPERARGVPAFASGDIFALGAIMAQLLGANQPAGQNTLALLHRIGTGAWRPVVPASAPADLRGLVSRMLQLEPRLRPTARQVADALRTAYTPAAVTAKEFPAVGAKIAEELLPPVAPAVAVEGAAVDDGTVDDAGVDGAAHASAPCEGLAVVAAPSDVMDGACESAPVVAAAANGDATRAPADEAVIAGRPPEETGSPRAMIAEAAVASASVTLDAGRKADLSEEVATSAAAREAPLSSASDGAFDATMKDSGPTPLPPPLPTRRPSAPELAPSVGLSEGLRAQIAPTNPEVPRVEAPATKSKLPWIAMAVVATGCIALLSSMLLSGAKPQAVTIAPAEAVAPLPLSLEDDEADLLAPLVEVDSFEPHADPTWVESAESVPVAKLDTRAAVPVKQRPLKKPPVRLAKKSEDVRPALDVKAAAENVEAVKTPAAGNFDFLDQTAPAPSSELKRPSF